MTEGYLLSTWRCIPFLLLTLFFTGCFPFGEEEQCDNTCIYAYDGECDDGGPNSQYSVCDCGTDCDDCGSRTELDCDGSSSSSSGSSSSSSGGSSSSGSSSSGSSGSSSGGSSSSSSSGGGGTANFQFFLKETYSNVSLQCLLPLTIKVYKVPPGEIYSLYCESGSSACACGSSFFDFVPSGTQAEAYGTQSITISEGSSINPPGCGAAGVASYNLPVGDYIYRWESPVCCTNVLGWNGKCFGYSGYFSVTTADTQEPCVMWSVYIPNLSTSNPTGLNWIMNNCQ